MLPDGAVARAVFVVVIRFNTTTSLCCRLSDSCFQIVLQASITTIYSKHHYDISRRKDEFISRRLQHDLERCNLLSLINLSIWFSYRWNEIQLELVPEIASPLDRHHPCRR